MAVGGVLALVYAFFAIHLRADQIVGGTGINFLALGITGYFYVQLYNNAQIPDGVSLLPNVHILSGNGLLSQAFGDLNVLTWAELRARDRRVRRRSSRRRSACGSAPAASIPRAADTVGINVYAVRYGCVVLSGVLAAIGGIYLSLGPEGQGRSSST